MPFLLGVILAAGPAHPELGRVSWSRDFEAARAQSRKTGRPMLVLFDEVPGCATVRGFGSVLSNPALVARLERDFVPVAIFNNVGGEDRRVLEQFGEPSWNNPVVRVMNAELQPLAPRFSGPYTIDTFEKVLDGVVPAPARSVETLLVSAPCFWECEAQLGRLPAVRASRAGFIGGEEVVEVEFDRLVTSREAMIGEADRLQCATHVFAQSAAELTLARSIVGARAVSRKEPFRVSEKDTKYYLRQSPRAKEALSPLEQVRINAALRFGDDPEQARASCRTK